MRGHIYILFVLALLIAAGIPQLRSSRELSGLKQGSRPQETFTRIKIAMPGVRLTYCSDKGLGVNFLCDYGWGRRRGDNFRIVIINTQPDVQLKIVKIDVNIVSIRQLNKEKLKDIGKYRDGFVIEESKVASLDAIKVKAFSRTDPEVRLLDYYVVRDKTLYGLMFSVSPKEEWDGYKFLFEYILRNFRFI